MLFRSELRITLGQLSEELRRELRFLKVYGSGDLAIDFASEFRDRATALGLTLQRVTKADATSLGMSLPADAEASGALMLAARHIAGRPAAMDFLPPRISPWQAFASRYSSKKLAYIGFALGAVALIILGFFFFQEFQLQQLDGK